MTNTLNKLKLKHLNVRISSIVEKKIKYLTLCAEQIFS